MSPDPPPPSEHQGIVPSAIVLLLAEDDDGHALLVEDILRNHGLCNAIVRFHDGQEALDFFNHTHPIHRPVTGVGYLLLLDIRMPKVDGVDVLRNVKQNPLWQNMPVIMLTTTDDPREVDRCHALGCNSYVHKPVDYDKFTEAVRRLGLYLEIVQVPPLGVS